MKKVRTQSGFIHKDNLCGFRRMSHLHDEVKKNAFGNNSRRVEPFYFKNNVSYEFISDLCTYNNNKLIKKLLSRTSRDASSVFLFSLNDNIFNGYIP